MHAGAAAGTGQQWRMGMMGQPNWERAGGRCCSSWRATSQPVGCCSGWIPRGELTRARGSEWPAELGIFPPDRRASAEGVMADRWAAPAIRAHVVVARIGHPSGSG
jgi:hypothetical protein